ncbi:MAG TPA: SRPBCC family protein [Candidatus Thermoplasmatota archaeon]|nr:SRPBCC family protein [Candidatus Thermoplasmatota archaeon]
MSENTQGDKMHKVEASVDCDVPISIAYDQWTQFEEFPRFMKNIESVEQRGDTHLHWVASVAGQRKEWDAEIVEQEPDRLISWKSTSGTLNNGAVLFEVLAPGQCRIKLVMTYAPEGVVEKAGSALGLLKAQIEGDLGRFKRYIENRQVPSGAWRGEVHDAVEGKPNTQGGIVGKTPAEALEEKERGADAGMPSRRKSQY